MASRSAIAARQGAARDRLQSAMARLAEREGVELPPPVSFPYRQPELRAAAEMERLADFVESLVSGPPEKPSRKPDEAKPEPEGNDEPQDGDEPTFGGKPLSWYDGKSDEEILNSPEVRVGEKTLAKIRAAQG